MARVPLAGTDYIPGVSESNARSSEIKTMLDRYLENPIDELPAAERVRSDEPRSRRRSSRSTPSSSRASASPTRRTWSLVEDIDLEAATPGQDINWLEDVELLEEEGTPAVFDRYSNSFLKIYFPIPEGRENEIARKVLMTHLQAGNSYGIRLKEKHCKFPAARARARGSRTRERSARTGGRPCSKAGNLRCTDDALRQAPRDRCRRPRAVDRLAPRRAGRAGADRGQDRRGRGRVRDRLRRGAQQLLPARHVRADGGLRRDLGVGPRDASHYHGSGYVALGRRRHPHEVGARALPDARLLDVQEDPALGRADLPAGHAHALRDRGLPREVRDEDRARRALREEADRARHPGLHHRA